MKTIVIAGRLTRDAELRRTQAGDAVLGFSVAVDDGYGERKKTLFFDCSLFGKRGQSLEDHMRKGSQVTVSGDFSTREHDGKSYMQIRVSDLTLQGGKPSEGRARQEPEGSYGAQSGLDDEIPFMMEWR
ncbi:single-stranded DNA-binding protein [Nitratireductor aquimarinus]|uniref:single-stranded DNA-binding protein n=1 Tax=Alphaproteobacteria TaxID=28211 RepID=UPI0019D3DEC5|nr:MULTISPECIES: single-stranded DNA-binding protein [Alphaproteobacteria]MBN7755451.1 single-stranded DNA-binding protein [Nitratireductor aquimarinus]MBY5998206.1 single-stranded DNA-binding protein [Tritonibacter mobilis]MBY6020233.1 single-stranded DNA-binding protein [Nitratireductor sp. DP7N14-4]